jgi:hypothetical protein
MSVNLSMLAGAGAQFFDNNGVILSGGLVYTYAAGTTTPQAAYTTSSGSTAHTNPIVLDSAGRVPSGGEIWLTDAVSYKFLLKTSAAVTIATYDNVTGNASGIYAAFAASSGSSLVGYLPAGTGAVATTVQSKLRQIINVLDFGANTTPGTTDMTSAIQAAINYALSVGGEVFVPPGQYVVTSELLILGTYPGQGISLYGVNGGSGLGSQLLWKGNSTTASILHLRGTSWSKISNLIITSANIDTYPCLGALYIDSAQNYSSGPGSSGVMIEECLVTGGKGTNSFAIRIGENDEQGPQVSELTFRKVFTVAAYSAATSAYVTNYGFWVNAAGNAKDMTFSECAQVGFTVAGVYYSATAISGWCQWYNLGGGGSACDFKVDGVGNLQVIGGGSEGSKKVLIQTGSGSNSGSTYFYGYQAEQMTTTDTFFIEAGASGQVNLDLRNCRFDFANSGSYYIKYNNGGLQNSGTSTSGITSTNCFYEYASGIIPVWSYEFIGTALAYVQPANVYSIGDWGGTAGALSRLLSIYGTKPQRFDNLSYVDSDWYSTRGLTAANYAPAIAPSVRKFTIPYTSIINASTTTSFYLLDIPAYCKVTSLYAVVSATFTLGASTISMTVGTATGNEYLLSKTISGGFTGAVGNTVAELGSYLAPTTAVQGGHAVFSSVDQIRIVFNSTSGNFGNGTATSLTTGSVDIYFVTQDLS